MKLFEEANILDRHDFGDGRARYEESTEKHHDHLIDMRTGEVIEFVNQEIERLQAEVAEKYGYQLVAIEMRGSILMARWYSCSTSGWSSASVRTLAMTRRCPVILRPLWTQRSSIESFIHPLPKESDPNGQRPGTLPFPRPPQGYWCLGDPHQLKAPDQEGTKQRSL